MTTRPRDRFTTVFSTKSVRRERVEAMGSSRESVKSHQDSGEIDHSLELDLDITQHSREDSSEIESKTQEFDGPATPSPTPVKKRSKRSSRKSSMEKDFGRQMSASVRRLRPSKALLQLETASVAHCVQAMVENRTEATLVTDANGTLTGILTDKDIALRVVAKGLDPMTTRAVDVMTPNPSCVSPRACAIEALEQMISGQFRHLPVADNGNVVGILDIAKCLYDAISRIEQAYMATSNQFSETMQKLDANINGNEASLFEKMRETLFFPTLSSIIDGSVDVPQIQESATTHEASLLMLQNNSSAVMVFGPSGAMLGILTTKDLMRRVLALSKDPAVCLVRDAMTSNPDCARLDTTILDALHSMHDGKFLHLPVLNDNGAVVGLADVLQVTCSVVHQMGSFQKQHTAMVNPVWNKFWSSMLNPPSPPQAPVAAAQAPVVATQAPVVAAQDPVVTTNAPVVATHAPVVAAPTPSASTHSQKKSLLDEEPDTFVYKLTDASGNIHRFTSSAVSLELLHSEVASRLGWQNPKSFNIYYVDEDAETVLLFADTDLKHAVTQAKLRAATYIRLKTQLIPLSTPEEDSHKDFKKFLEELPEDESKFSSTPPGVASVMTESKIVRKNRKMIALALVGASVTTAAVAFLRKKT
ncbi:myosin [Thraustotheca clavata]|uniref:Myosin n=1 Tax=Thraustotheca clavata TaxID=74557 RepID=A0A1V9ZN56_9STRA|nr:myosin [Thraustotheca clavata]